MWSRRNDNRWLAAALRQQRAEAPPELVRDLSSRVRLDAAGGRRWSRIAFAAAISVFVFGSFASFGGLGYAASGASGTYGAVKRIAIAHKLTFVVHKSAAADEYPTTPTPPPSVPTTPAPTTPTPTPSAPTTPAPTTPAPTTPAPTTPAPAAVSTPAAFAPPKTPSQPAVRAAIAVQGQKLPFTGYSLLGTFLASLGLIVAGIFLRRRERRSS